MITVHDLITRLMALPAHAPVGIAPLPGSGGWDLIDVKYDGEYVVLTGGNPNDGN